MYYIWYFAEIDHISSTIYYDDVTFKILASFGKCQANRLYIDVWFVKMFI